MAAKVWMVWESGQTESLFSIVLIIGVLRTLSVVVTEKPGHAGRSEFSELTIEKDRVKFWLQAVLCSLHVFPLRNLAANAPDLNPIRDFAVSNRTQ